MIVAIAVKAFVSRIPSAILIETIIHEAVALCKAFDEGLAISECISADNPAVAEMQNIYREVFESDKSPLNMPIERSKHDRCAHRS